MGRGYLSGIVAVLRRRKSPQGLQLPSGLGTMRRGLDHEEAERQTIHAFSILRNSALVEASNSGSKRLALAKTGGPGAVGRLRKTLCLGVEAEKPLEERKSRYSNRGFRISLGACCRCVHSWRRNGREDIQRICIQNSCSGNVN